ncbi:hypothetical protein F6455_03215 [Proteobacteria bacterium 005FR1]|nr:hypothetical protein [Proteobacteria bacterium 005FR1]
MGCDGQRAFEPEFETQKKSTHCSMEEEDIMNKRYILAATASAFCATSALAQQGASSQSGDQQWTQEFVQAQGAPIYLSTAGLRQIQSALNNLGYNAGNVSGQWSNQTAQALRAFQQARGITPTGTPTIDTINALGATNVLQGQGLAQSGDMQWQQESVQGPGVPVYISSAYVRQIQQALSQAGYNAPVSGQWNQQTQQAAANFQAANNLEPTGQPDANLIAELGLNQQIFGAGQQLGQAGTGQQGAYQQQAQAGQLQAASGQPFAQPGQQQFQQTQPSQQGQQLGMAEQQGFQQQGPSQQQQISPQQQGFQGQGQQTQQPLSQFSTAGQQGFQGQPQQQQPLQQQQMSPQQAFQQQNQQTQQPLAQLSPAGQQQGQQRQQQQGAAGTQGFQQQLSQQGQLGQQQAASNQQMAGGQQSQQQFQPGQQFGQTGQQNLQQQPSQQGQIGQQQTGNQQMAAGVQGAQQGQQLGQGGQNQQQWAQEQAAGAGAALWASPATVRQVEATLGQRGFDPGQIDGAWDQQTSQAIQHYQRTRGLEPTGTLTTQTMASLDISPMGGQFGQGQQGQLQSGQQQGQFQQDQQFQQGGQQNLQRLPQPQQ